MKCVNIKRGGTANAEARTKKRACSRGLKWDSTHDRKTHEQEVRLKKGGGISLIVEHSVCLSGSREAGEKIC